MSRPKLARLLCTLVALLVLGRAAFASRGGVDEDDPPDAAPRAVDEAVDELLDLARGCARRRLPVNAADLLLRCLALTDDERARAELERLLDDDRLLDVILAADVGLEALAEERRFVPEPLQSPPAWSEAVEVKSRNYTVRTNLGEAAAEEIARTMEDVNAFCRDVFSVRRGGGGTARLELRVYATRAQFEAEEGPFAATTTSIRRGTERVVATYDRRDDGLPFAALRPTLLHQGALQFSCLVSRGAEPGWLRHGTACSLEAARILPSGRVVDDRIPRARLVELVRALDRGHPSLEEVVSFSRPGAIPPSHFPVAWGLVRFLERYEDDASRRVYAPLLARYRKACRSGGEHDRLERFEDQFVNRARERDVRSLSDLRVRFEAWARALAARELDPADGADRWVELGRVQLENGRAEAAAESFAHALRADPSLVEAHLGRADALAKERRKDVALHHLRRAYELARVAPAERAPAADPTEIARAMRRLDATLARAVPASCDAWLERAAAAEAAGAPGVALALRAACGGGFGPASVRCLRRP